MTFFNRKVSRQATIMQCPGTVDAAFLSQAMQGLREQAPWHVPLFQALLAGEIAMLMPLPGQALPMARLETLSAPIIILICDDGPITAGPTGWTCAEQALRWAAASIVNGTGGDPKIYISAVEAVREIKRLTICDTSSAHFDAWRHRAAAAGDKAVLGFRPPQGHCHPQVSS